MGKLHARLLGHTSCVWKHSQTAFTKRYPQIVCKRHEYNFKLYNAQKAYDLAKSVLVAGAQERHKQGTDSGNHPAKLPPFPRP